MKKEEDKFDVELKEQRQILLIINDTEICKKVETSIHEKFGFEIEIAREGKEGLEKIEEAPRQYDVVVLYDDFKEKLTGMEVLREIKKKFPEIEVIFITNSPEKTTVEAWREGAFNCFPFPPNHEEISYAVKCAIEQSQLQRERKMVGKLQKIVDLLELAHLATSKFEILDACIDEMLAIFDAHAAIIYETSSPLDADPKLLENLDLEPIYKKNIDCNFDIPKKLLLKIKSSGPQTFSANEFPKEWNPIKKQYSQFLVFTLDFQNETLGLVMLFTKVGIPFILHEADRYSLASGISRQLAIAFKNIEITEEIEKTRAASFTTAKSVAAGQIATGFVHEVKNSLNTIAMIVGNIGKRIEKDPAIESKQEYIDKIKAIETEIWRSYELSKRLQRFGQHLTPQKTEVYLNDVVLTTIELLDSTIKKHILELKTKLDPALDKREIEGDEKFIGNPIYIDKGQIEQVLINLILNAIEASEQRSRLLVETKLNESDVEIKVTDYGKGINSKLFPEIFKPFFTTKQGGVGLGLYISKLIIEESHQGKITIKSKPGKETTISIKLPIQKYEEFIHNEAIK